MRLFFLFLKKKSFVSLLLIFSTLWAVAQPSPQRIPFTLKNNLGYHRMFRVEGPGIAYGFTMNRNERTEKSWPMGARLYYSTDGEDRQSLLFTVDEQMAGQVIPVYSYRKNPGALPEVLVRFRNNSLWFRRVAIISYRPDETGNGTTIVAVAPYGSIKRGYPAGTRIYVADNEQVNTVMSGKRLSGTPFLVVAATDAGKTYPLFR